MNYRTVFGLSTAFLFIAFVATADADTDGDGVSDVDDNCILVANAPQKDSDDDGFGNICDPDLNNDCVVGGPDFTTLIFCINLPGEGVRHGCFDADLNSDHKTNSSDLRILESMFGLPPGPSGLASCE